MSLTDNNSMDNDRPRIIQAIYRQGKIELMESIQDLDQVDLYVLIVPSGQEPRSSAECLTKSGCNPGEEFKMIGLHLFLDPKDDAHINWEDVFGVKGR